MRIRSNVGFLLKVSRPGKIRLLMASVLVALSSFCFLGPFYIAYLCIEKLLSSTPDFSGFSCLAGAAALFVVAQLVLSGIAMRHSHIAAYNILRDLRVTIAQKIMRLPLGFFTNNSSGMLKKIIMGNVESIEGFIAHSLVDLLSVLFLPFILFFWLATYNLPLALLSVLPVVLGVGLQRLRMILESEKIHRFFKLKSDMNTTIVDFIRGMPVIKAFNQSVYSFKKYKKEAEAYSDYWIGLNKKASPFFVAYSLFMDCGVVFILPIGAYMLLNKSISLSTFLLFMFIGLGLSRFMKQLTAFGSNLTQTLKGVEQIRNVMQSREIEEHGKTEKIDHHDLEFSNVSFGYNDAPTLKGLNFLVPQGSVTALVGPSGAGKTTVGRLIPRFWDVDAGEIKIGGVNIKELKTEVLMEKVSFVFQDIFMFDDSVLENIRMGDLSISFEEVVEIAKKAQAHDFIMQLKDGYNTRLGSGGIYLSGGERQRIAIARALTKDSPIIVLDEATSYADPENESRMQEAVNSLLENKTVIVIAHRLSTIQGADQILVFDSGEIVERGTHEELLSKKGRYKSMWDMHMDAADWSIGSGLVSLEGSM